MNLASSPLTLIATTAPPQPVPDPGPPPASPSPFGWEFILALVVFMAASIFLIQRPKQKQEDEKRRREKEGLKKGERVVSAGGIHGVVSRTNKVRDTVFVTVAKNLELEFNRTALTVVKDEPEADDKGGKKQKDTADETDPAAIEKAGSK